MTTCSPRAAGAVLAVLAAVGCAAVPHVNPPDELHYRAWENAAPTGESLPDALAVTAAGLSARLTPDRPVPAPPGDPPARPLNVLALSGGGKFSAFDAGLLNGWTRTGTRPPFDVVTGISSGALTALYAFLGPKYDEKLKTNYLTVKREQLFKLSVHKTARTAALASSEPLKAYIANDTTPEVLADIRAAHTAGRRLYIGTNNLTLHRPVIWDVGAIACSGRPDADELVRKIFLAACSIPAWTPPVEFDVVVNGVAYKELHTDGGNQTQAFVQTPNGLPAGSNVFVMTAGKAYPDSLTARPKFFGMVIAGVSESLYALYRADMMTLYALCAATNSQFRVVALPPEFRGKPSSLSFDPEDLQRLYDLGYRWGVGGIPWQTAPPGVLPGHTNVPRTGLSFVVK